MHSSLRSKRFFAVQEQRMRNKSQSPREKWLSFHFSRGQNRKSPSSVSLFAPKLNGNARYAGEMHSYKITWSI